MSTTPFPTPERDAWRCTNCEQLMYNLTPTGSPAPGAPVAKFWSVKHPAVCSVCYDMALAANTQYMIGVSAEEKRADELKRNKIERLSGKKDYFTGEDAA